MKQESFYHESLSSYKVPLCFHEYTSVFPKHRCFCAPPERSDLSARVDIDKVVLGLVPSIPKSTTFFCNVPNAIKASILNSMPFAEDVCPLKDLFSNIDIARSGFSLNDSVSNLISDGVWRWPLDWLSRFPFMAQLQVPLLLDDMMMSFYGEIGMVWSKVRALCGMDAISPRLIDSIAFIVPISKGKTFVNIFSWIVVATTSYYLWLERNRRFFKKKTSSPDKIIDVIFSMVWLKLATFKFKKMSAQSCLLLDQWKILSYCIVHDGSARLTWIAFAPIVLLLVRGMFA
ncbi:hypothetical protein Tco_0847098 [Tanacetum coccineum]